MKKIGLINVQNIDNYGANLISFSLEKEIKSYYNNDVDVVTVNYCPKQLNSNNLSNKKEIDEYIFLKKEIYGENLNKSALILKNKRFKYTIKEKAYNILFFYKNDNEVLKNLKLRKKNFQKYRKLVLSLGKKCKTVDEVSKCKCDSYIIGSDVVWKPARLLGSESDVYFGNFNPESKKIAYAASIGVDDKELLNKLAPRYKEKLQNIDCISVREFDAVDYVKGLTDKEVYNCIDPTFLRTKADYEELIKKNKGFSPDNEKFIYVYLLGKNQTAYEYANKLAKEKGYKICYYANNPELLKGNLENTIGDGPLEFLYRIANAEYVITDSFHGTALSIIFSKSFLTFTRGIMSIRLKNLLEKIEAKERMVDSDLNDVDIDKPVDYEKIHGNINKWVDSSREYLKKSLGV